MLFSKVVYLIWQIYSYVIFKKKVRAFGFFSVRNRDRIQIGQDCVINQGVYLSSRNKIAIGNNVVLSARCMLIDSGFDLNTYIDAPQNERPYLMSAIVIEDNVWIGAGAIVLPNTHIGQNSIIGAGSVVTKDVAAFSVVAGNPAKLIRKLSV
jgi:maltose O-acetyltransferase